jgi:hypothetical protein
MILPNHIPPRRDSEMNESTGCRENFRTKKSRLKNSPLVINSRKIFK